MEGKKSRFEEETISSCKALVEGIKFQFKEETISSRRARQWRSSLPPPLPSPSLSQPPIAPAAPLFFGRHTFDPAIRRLARAHCLSDIEVLLEPLKDPRAFGEAFLAVVILHPVGMIDHTLHTLDNIPSLGNPRIDLSLNVLLLALNDFPLSSCCRIPDLSNRLSIAPDKVSYGILIKSHCLLSDAKKAFAVLKEMDQGG